MKTILKPISKHVKQNNMKKSLCIALFTIASITGFAQNVLTVSNSPFGGAQYSTLIDAYNAAANGDTLHVEGTNVSYFVNFFWAKSLTVIGIGFNADKQNTAKTYFSYANSQSGVFVFAAASSGSQFHGIHFQQRVETRGASNLLFANCFFGTKFNLSSLTTNGLTIRNSIFNSTSTCFDINAGTTVVSGVSISNCVFNGYIGGVNNPNVTMNVDHCLFLGNLNIYQLRNATISNSIFMNTFVHNSNSDCNFINNISRVAGTFPPAGSGNIASNNIEATDPMLVNYNLGGFYSFTHDLNLQAGSAAIGAGSDGTDIGVHGGTNMFFSETGEVLINPIIREVSILNPTVTPNGTLEVKIIATKPNDN